MKSERKITTYPSILEGIIYEYRYLVNDFFQTSVDTLVQVRHKRKVRSKAPDSGLNSFVIPGEVSVLPTHVDPEVQTYDLITLKDYCNALEHKTLLIKKIKSQADVYIMCNTSLLRNLIYNLAGLIASIVIAILYQRIVMSQEPGIGLFGFLFKCISIYLGVSILYQSLKAFVNTIISKHELLFWKKVTVGLLDEKEYAYYVIAPLSGLKRSLYVVYPSFLMVYLILFYYSYKFPMLLQSLTFSWL